MTYTKDNIVFEPIPSNSRLIDLTHLRIGNRYILGYAGKATYGTPLWWYECLCGKIAKAGRSALLASDSCGCRGNQPLNGNRRTHGLSESPTYKIWGGMMHRCRSSRSEYGGRGIGVCERWHSFENFLEDMGERPSSNHSIDRRDNDGDYSPENCRWATPHEQANNRRSNINITFANQTHNLKQWAKLIGLNYGTLHDRYKQGWSIERMLTTPSRYDANGVHFTSPLRASSLPAS